MPYRTLDADRIIDTAERLALRIGERFPDSGLRNVACELEQLSRDSAREAAKLAAPIVWLRIVTGLVVGAGAAVFAFVGTILSFDRISTGAFDFVQGVEASVNTLVLAGIGFVTLVSLEERFKRKQVFEGLHALRSIIHVIDMHQLTKDPAALSSSFRPTKSSPVRQFNAQDLTRYLDYCSEMLSLTGKLAALYAQSVNDPTVADAVNDIENLGTNLSRKIWQKIMLIDAYIDRPEPAQAVTAPAVEASPMPEVRVEVSQPG
ncbi:MAG TPA: hypothetical protein PKE65_00250 [Rhizobiaceae bacterium]|nr:hypothetical protein [Rhizobiaceae bacterium]